MTLAPSEKPIPIHTGECIILTVVQVASLPHSLWGTGNIIRFASGLQMILHIFPLVPVS